MRADYFLERREKIRRGEDVEPLVCRDALVFEQQQTRESILHKNAQYAEQDRRAGIVAA